MPAHKLGWTTTDSVNLLLIMAIVPLAALVLIIRFLIGQHACLHIGFVSNTWVKHKSS